MPIYPYVCPQCGKSEERVLPMVHEAPVCCGQPMQRRYAVDNLRIKEYGALWIDRIDDIHKAQEQRGERLRIVHPSEVL